MPVMSSARRELEQRRQDFLDMGLEPEIEARLHGVARCAGEPLVGDDAQARLEYLLAGDELCDRLAEPADGAIGGQHELLVRGLREPRGARVDLAGQRLLRGAGKRLGFRARGRASGVNMKPSSRPMVWPSTTTSPVLLISVSSPVFSRSRRISTLVRRSTKRSVSRSCSASESLSSTARVTPCQCSGSASQSGRLAAKVQVRIWAMRFDSVSMSPSVWSACSIWRANQSVGDLALPHQEAVERDDKLGVGGRRHLAIVGDLADLPQPLERFARLRHLAHVVVARGVLEHQDVLGDRRARQARLLRNFRQRSLQGAEREEIEIGIAPLQELERLERMAFERLHQFGLERRAAAGGAEGAVARGAAGAAGDLGELGGVELAELIAVEFAVGGKGDVIDVEIESHADGVGGNEIFDVAGLVERDLGVARARRERAEHHRGAAALAFDQLGDRIDFVGRERDDGGAARLPRDLFLAGECQLRQPRAREHMRAGQQAAPPSGARSGRRARASPRGRGD